MRRIAGRETGRTRISRRRIVWKKISRRGIVWIFPCLAASFLLAGGVRAYFADGDGALNSFRIGVNTITPEEEFEPPQPGSVTVKKPWARNTGSVSCYVRARVLLSDSRAGDYIHYQTQGEEGIRGEGWSLGEDGYYYFQNPIAPGEETGPLFTGIYMEEELPRELDGTTVDVYFESVQAQGADRAEEAFEMTDGR